MSKTSLRIIWIFFPTQDFLFGVLAFASGKNRLKTKYRKDGKLSKNKPEYFNNYVKENN